MSTTLKIIEISKNGSVKINIQTSLPTIGSRGTGLNQNLILNKTENGWNASIEFDETPTKDTPEEAAQRLSEWLLVLSKAVKGKNIKPFKVTEIFNPRYFK